MEHQGGHNPVFHLRQVLPGSIYRDATLLGPTTHHIGMVNMSLTNSQNPGHILMEKEIM